MKQKKIPMRMCIGCKEMHPKKELIRIVIPKEGEMDTDLSGKAHGRGAYLCRQEECLQKAAKQRSLRLSQDLVEKIRQEIGDAGSTGTD